jgi:transcriptional regulator GlxA family with amidase domain
VGTHDVVVVGYDGAELVDIAAVTSVLALANRLGADPAYHCVLASVSGEDIACDSGLSLRAQARLSAVPQADTVVVSGGLGHVRAATDPTLVRQVRRLAQGATRVGSVCTGSTVLAAAGLLRGKRATTHWRYAKQFAAAFPGVQVDPAPIFIRDGRIATSGGVTASLDLTLAFVEEDHGAELARWVAMGMVTYLQRPGNQAQMSVFVASPHPDDALVRRALDRVIADPGADHSTSALAREVGVSPRQLHRLFVQHLTETPGAAVRRIRLEAAGRLIVTTELTMSQIAGRTGFATAETLRQAFVGRYGVTPRDFRNGQKAYTEAAQAAFTSPSS